MSGPTPFDKTGIPLFTEQSPGIVQLADLLDYINEMRDLYYETQEALQEAQSYHYFTSVKEFGAVGDGVTDDTNAFKSALNSSTNIYVPIGTYLISDTLVMKPFTKVFMVGTPSDYITPSNQMAILRATNNKPAFSMDNCCVIKGGRIETTGTFSTNLITVDYSTKRLNNLIIDTTLKGSINDNSIGILFKGNGDNGLLYQINIDGRIHEFGCGIKTDKVSGNSWATGGLLNAKITNCKKAIDANTVFGGGVIAGSIQPLLKGGSYPVTTEPLVKLTNLGNFDLNPMLWDLSQAINSVGLELNKCEFFEIPSKIDPFYIRNNSIRNIRKINPVEPPRQSTTYYNSMSGNDENILFGSNKKFVVTITNSSNVSIISSNASYDRNGMFELKGKPTYINLNTGTEEWVSIQIDFDTPKNINLFGFVPKSEAVLRPKEFNLSTKIQNATDFVLKRNGKTSDLLYSGGDISETGLYVGLPFNERSNIISLKFDFLIETNKPLVLESLFAKGNGHADSYLPLHGGSIYGDVTIEKGNIILKSPDGLTRKRLTIDNAGNLILINV